MPPRANGTSVARAPLLVLVALVVYGAIVFSNDGAVCLVETTVSFVLDLDYYYCLMPMCFGRVVARRRLDARDNRRQCHYTRYLAPIAEFGSLTFLIFTSTYSDRSIARCTQPPFFVQIRIA